MNLSTNTNAAASETPCSTPSRVASGSSPHPVFWVIAACLIVIAATQAFRTGSTPWDGVAWAQPTLSAGARGMFAFTGQLSKTTYGVFLVDADAQTIWAYEYMPQKACLRLAASRTWRYDRYLENYNVCDLPPEAVEKMVEEQRLYRLEAAQEDNSQ